MGPKLGQVGAKLDQVGTKLAQDGAKLGQVGTKMGHFGAKLGPCWTRWSKMEVKRVKVGDQDRNWKKMILWNVLSERGTRIDPQV